MKNLLIKSRPIPKSKPIIPPGLLILGIMVLIAGYFIGGATRAIALQHSYDSTVKFIRSK